MTTTAKNWNSGLWGTPEAFALSFAGSSDCFDGGSDCPVAAPGVLSSRGMGWDLMDLGIAESPKEFLPGEQFLPAASHRGNYQTEYGPPIVSFRDAFQRIPN